MVKKVLTTLKLEERELATHGFSLFSSWHVSSASFRIPDDVRRRIEQDMKVNSRNQDRVEESIAEGRAQLSEEKRKRKAKAYLDEARRKPDSVKQPRPSTGKAVRTTQSTKILKKLPPSPQTALPDGMELQTGSGPGRDQMRLRSTAASIELKYENG